jgi:hypothetical protein
MSPVYSVTYVAGPGPRNNSPRRGRASPGRQNASALL